MTADPEIRPRSPVTDVFAVLCAEWPFIRRSLLRGRLGAFALYAVLSGLGLYAYFAIYHFAFSNYSPSSDVLLSTLLGGGSSSDASSVGEGVLWLSVLSVFLLGFEVRARDELVRIDGALDARPVSNLALVLGRLTAIVLAHWLLLAGALLLCHLIGFHPWRDAEQGFAQALSALAPFSGRSLLLFLFVDALPVLFLWGALVFLLVSLLRNRAAVLAVAFVLVGAYSVVVYYAPPSLLPLLGIPIARTALQSDLAATTPSVVVGLQRIFVLVFAGGCVALAAAWHPRQDDGRTRGLAIGASLVVGAVVGALLLAAWLIASATPERPQSALLPADALKKLTASVEIEPGDALALDVQMLVTVPPAQAGSPSAANETLALSLNPGLQVQALRIDGASIPFEHNGGLLTFGLPQPDARQVTLSLVAAGKPAARFGYARNRPSDSSAGNKPSAPVWTDAPLAYRWSRAWTPLDALGTERAIFDSRYVALMPEAHWLPTFGDGASYFGLDLTVEVPPGWLVAAPGRREAAPASEAGEPARFRFAPATPVSEVGLFASRFESRQVPAGDVLLETLFNPKHRRNFALFGDVADELGSEAQAAFDGLASLGLPYPYQALTIVEVPRTLRVYDSRWRMGSVQALPGIMLLREGGFPTARFEFALRWLGFRLGYQAYSRSQFKAADLPAAKLDFLKLYFGNDVTGGNPWQAAAQQWFALHTYASGEAALALDYLAQALALRLLTDRPAYFSAHSLSGQSSLGAAVDVFADLLTSTEQTIGAAVFAAETGQPAVWERLLAEPLTQLEGNSGTMLGVHTLKADAVARIVLAQFGREPVARLLARLLERHRGTTFDEADFKAALADAGMGDALALVDGYLHGTALPGFVATPLRLTRLAADANGMPRYQAQLRVYNGEPTKGYVRLRYTLNGEDPYRVHAGEVVALDGHSAKEIGLVTALPLASVAIDPFLALNRHPIPLELPELESARVGQSAFVGSRSIPWRPAQEAGIVIDDLDPGFAIEAAADNLPWWERPRQWLRGQQPAGWLRSGGDALDQGLPRFDAAWSPAGVWVRAELPPAFGKYRPTVALAMAGSAYSLAVFKASLPADGRWRLEYHIPSKTKTLRPLLANMRRLRQGRYQMALDGGSTKRDLSFNAADAASGWNRVGTWDLPAGDVYLRVSTETNGAMVIADAIRWCLEEESP